MMHLVHKWLRARENDAKNSSDNQGRPNLMQKARWQSPSCFVVYSVGEISRLLRKRRINHIPLQHKESATIYNSNLTTKDRMEIRYTSSEPFLIIRVHPNVLTFLYSSAFVNEGTNFLPVVNDIFFERCVLCIS